MISDEAMRLIRWLKAVGYGWAKFAASVERSGRCSAKQFETMVSMRDRIEAHRSRDYSSLGVARASPSEQAEALRRRVEELERELEQERFDRMMERVNGTDDRPIGPP